MPDHRFDLSLNDLRRCCCDTVAYHIARGKPAVEGIEYGCHWCQDSIRFEDGRWKSVRYDLIELKPKMVQEP